MTALDDHRQRNTDESTVDELRDRITAAGVEYLYYQVVTLTGRTVSKVVPARHLERNLIRGVQFHRTAMTDLHSDNHGALLGGGVQAAEFTALPDLDTFTVLPWDTTVGRFLCAAYEPDRRSGVGGDPLDTDVRGNLRRVHRGFTDAIGLQLRSGCEPEMSWLGPGMDVHVRPGGSAAYSTANLELMRPIYQRVITYAQAMGLDMIEGDYEDPRQLELNWQFDDCELTLPFPALGDHG